MSRLEPTSTASYDQVGSERLTLAAGRMAGRLADLLERALAADEVPASRDFLRAMAAEAENPTAHMRSDGADDPLRRLVGGFVLTPLEVDLVILAGLPDEHEGYSGILRSLHPANEPRPTAGLAAQLFTRNALERRELRRILESGTAVRSGVLRLTNGNAPLFERSLELADSLWAALHGLNVWPESIEADSDPVPLAGLRHWLTSESAQRARAALEAAAWDTVLVTAETEEIAQQRGAALVTVSGCEPVKIEATGDITPDVERLISIHSVIRRVIPVVRIPAPTGPGGVEAPAFAEHPGPLLICGRFGGVLVGGKRSVLEVRAERLSPSARKELWTEVVPELGEHAAELAARYTVEPATAISAADDARTMARLGNRPLRVQDIAQGVRTRAGLALSSGVRLIRPTATWEQLVLPERRLGQLREALDRLLHQPKVLDEWRFLDGRPGARGVRMLFAGGSGTGKTFSSEVMAGTLGVDLLLVDISRVVSKWIGETEKNLAEVFDVAERAQAVLLFDEADALFGKRTEVSDAHDRYANLETAFLLTRLERFEGLAILSTNLRQNIDPAFMRRLEFVLDFEEPGPAERVALWKGHLPATAPLAPDVDLRELASQYAVVGGFIRNAAVAAGFLAAAESSPITRSHLVRAIRREYEKSGRAFPGYPAGMVAP